jgi:hypothetical protein
VNQYLFAVDSVVIVVAMPMMLDDHNFLVMMSVPVAVVVAVSISLYNNRVLGIRRSVRKSDRYNTKSNNSQNEISHLYPPNHGCHRVGNSEQRPTVP